MRQFTEESCHVGLASGTDAHLKCFFFRVHFLEHFFEATDTVKQHCDKLPTSL